MNNRRQRTHSGDGWYLIPLGVVIVCELYRVMWMHNQSTVDGTLQVDGRVLVGG